MHLNTVDAVEIIYFQIYHKTKGFWCHDATTESWTCMRTHFPTVSGDWCCYLFTSWLHCCVLYIGWHVHNIEYFYWNSTANLKLFSTLCIQLDFRKFIWLVKPHHLIFIKFWWGNIVILTSLIYIQHSLDYFLVNLEFYNCLASKEVTCCDTC